MLSKIRKTRETGFTLIELLTVIVIIGVIAAIAIPVFSAQRSRAQDTQTISDVRNIITAAETVLADRTKTISDLSQSSLEYKSNANVLWSIAGNTTTGGYCIAAFNASGKDYKSTSTLLTYDSTAGGLKKVGGSCGTTTGGVAGANGSVTPTPTSSTGVGSLVVTTSGPSATALSVVRSTTDSTSVNLSWTKSTDASVTGYKIQRSTDGTNYTDVASLGVSAQFYADSTAPASTVYYKIVALTSTGTSVNPLYGVAYSAPSGNTNSRTGSIQTFVVPDTGTYVISSYGGQGGSGVTASGGVGGYVSASYTLTAGQSINIVAGSVGGDGGFNGGGGGGGSFVYITGQAQPLQVAGGGGGSNSNFGGTGRNAYTTAGDPNRNTSNQGGASWNADPGATYNNSGRNAASNWSGGINGGGFGGGGATGSTSGGGGGYSGGGGGYPGDAGSNYVDSSTTGIITNAASNTGSGKVIISEQ